MESADASVARSAPCLAGAHVHIIDRYAYSNRIRTVDPAHKVGLALVVLVLCLVLNEPLVGFLAVAWMWGLATLLAGLPVAVFGRILVAEATFLVLTTVGVAININTSSPVTADWIWRVGPFWVSTSIESLDLALHLVTRALGGAAAMNFIALTTPLVDIVELCRRLGVPALLIDVMTVMYRFIFVLLDSLDRMRKAQESRLGYGSFRRSIQSAGLLASRLFIDAFQRSRDLQTALESRGYERELRVLPSSYRRDPALLLAALLVFASQLLAWRAV
jgi:cobalt/nickel transport system permease protein